MIVTGIKTRIFLPSESLFDFITEHVDIIAEGDILVITSKICALSENRVRDIIQKDKYIRQESKQIIETPWATLTLMNDGWGINAGIDESNANNTLILLPQNPFDTAHKLWKKLRHQFKLKKLGIIITDTRSVPLRKGTMGRAIGYAGVLPFKSYIGKKDLFNRKSRQTQSNIIDALASTAVCIMGEGNEQTPLVRMSDTPATYTQRTLQGEETILTLEPKKDIFASVFTFDHTRTHTRSKKK